MHTDIFDLDAGALCLDFANTMEWRNSDNLHEHLNSYTDVASWAEAAGIVSVERAVQLRHIAQNQPEKAGVALGRAIKLRETIYQIFAGYSEQGTVDEKEMAHFNEALSKAMSHVQVMPSAKGFAWGWTESTEGFEQILWPVARSAGELLTSEQLDRIHQCADDRGCGYLFVDTSRNHSRRWCSMESCGNRAKAQRHYKRKRKEQKDH